MQTATAWSGEWESQSAGIESSTQRVFRDAKDILDTALTARFVISHRMPLRHICLFFFRGIQS